MIIAFVFGVWLSTPMVLVVGVVAGIVAGTGKEIVGKLEFWTPDYLNFFMTVVGSLTAVIILMETK